MKILFIQKMAGVAGSETYYLNLLPELVRRGLVIEFACVEHPDEINKNDVFCASLADGGVRCHRLQARGPVPLKALWKLRGVIAVGQFDLVQTNLIHADLWGALLKILCLGKLKLISAKHGYSESYQAKHGFDPAYLKLDAFSFATRISGLFANRIFCISDGLRDLLVKGRLVSSAKTTTIHYGFDFDDVPRLLEPGKARFGRPQIITVARLVEVKQHEILLDCLPGLVSSFPGIKVVMIGDGPLKERLASYAKKLGVAEHIEWLGFKRNVHDYIRDSDILALPSAAEGFGLVILEAWYNRTPVVAFDVPALNEIISNGSDGLLVSPFDKVEYEESIRRLLADPTRIADMGEAGHRSYCNKYSRDALIKKTQRLYSDVVG